MLAQVGLQSWAQPRAILHQPLPLPTHAQPGKIISSIEHCNHWTDLGIYKDILI